MISLHSGQRDHKAVILRIWLTQKTSTLVSQVTRERDRERVNTTCTDMH